MASVVAPGTSGSMSADFGRLVAGNQARLLAEADDTLRVSGCATGLAALTVRRAWNGSRWRWRSPNSMRRFTRIAHVAAVS